MKKEKKKINYLRILWAVVVEMISLSYYIVLIIILVLVVIFKVKYEGR